MSAPPPDLSDLLDVLPTPVFAFDADGRHTYLNAAGCRFLGRPPEQVIGRTMAELGLPPELGAEYHADVLRVAAARAPFTRLATMPGPDGVVVMRVRLAPHPASGGVVGIATDVTAQVNAEKALRESEERYRQVVEDQTEVVCRFRADGTFTFVNDVYCRVFGKSADELLGRTWAPLVHPDDVPDVAARLATMSPGNPVVVIENRVTDAAGRLRWMEFVNRGFYAPGGTLTEVQAVGRDVTDRRAAEDARRAAEAAALAEAERARSERQLLESQKLESLGVLAGGLAHDFNNLLTVVLGNASLARMSLSAGTPADAELGNIEKAAHRAADLCQQMLAYAGRGQFQILPMDLNQVVREMAGLLSASVSKKAVLRFDPAPALPPVTGDPTQVRQVVMNLITNASDAIGDRSGVVTLTSGVIDADARYLGELALTAELAPGRYVYLEVSDTGSGMPDEVKARIFEPFYTTKFTGRGLGLSAVQGIVRAHKGAIKVYSQVGRGSTFKILFPADRPAAPPAEETAAAPGRAGRGRRVLVADDEEDVRVTTRRILEAHGFVVSVAVDGRDALDVFAARPADFALVVLDLTMPRMGGAEAFRELRRASPDVRVVLTSGFAANEATAGFEGKGLAGFVRKPFRIDELLAAVFSAVGP